MNPNQLSDHIAATYQSIRIGLAIVAFLFPPWLVIGGKIFANLDWQESMSAYYHASESSQKDAATAPDKLTHPGEGTMRNWFVGLLFGVGITLYLYKGFTWQENWALNIAGVMGLGVALFPMSWGQDFPGNQLNFLGLEFSLHGASAFALFIGIAYVCIYRAPDTLPLIKDEARKERYRKWYRLLGHMMWSFPVIAWVLTSTLTQHRNFVFLVEMLGVWIFGAYWCVKSREIAETNADKKALRDQLNVPEHGATSFLKAIPITE